MGGYLGNKWLSWSEGESKKNCQKSPNKISEIFSTVQFSTHPLIEKPFFKTIGTSWLPMSWRIPGRNAVIIFSSLTLSYSKKHSMGANALSKWGKTTPFFRSFSPSCCALNRHFARCFANLGRCPTWYDNCELYSLTMLPNSTKFAVSFCRNQNVPTSSHPSTLSPISFPLPPPIKPLYCCTLSHTIAIFKPSYSQQYQL